MAAGLMKTKVSKIKKYIIDIYTSGTLGTFDIWETQKIILLNIVFSVGIICLVPFGTTAFLIGEYPLCIVDFSAAASLIILFIYLRRTKDHKTAIYSGTLFMTVLFTYLFVTGGVHNTGHLWAYTYPLFTLFNLGRKKGSAISFSFLGLILLLTIPEYTFIPHIYSRAFISRFTGSFIAVFSIAYFSEFVRAGVQDTVIRKNIELKETVKDLESAQESLRIRNRAVDYSINAITLIDLTGQLIYVNPSFLKMWQCPDKKYVLGLSFSKLFEKQSQADDVVKVLYGKGVWQGELKGKRLDGSLFDVHVMASIVDDYNGKPIALTASFLDISDRKQAENDIINSLKEKEILLKEIHHRVKNNMQVISSLLRLQSDYIQDEKSLELLNESQNRISSMALVHEKLYRSDDLAKILVSDYIKNLTDNIITYFKNCDGNKNIIVSSDVEDISLGVDEAIPCGLIINELITNTFKHAYPNADIGKIDIEFRRNGNENYKLILRDDGVGIPDDVDFKNSNSLGLRLVNTLVKQLHGTVEINRTNGTEFKIEFNEAAT